MKYQYNIRLVLLTIYVLIVHVQNSLRGLYVYQLNIEREDFLINSRSILRELIYKYGRTK
jgi:hypothetical protein